ncbi:hypothetical protein LSUB1_G005851 [Lachnellula subtilissima]|uniref:DUF6546 domain-containing protein n=1 Tax=Lachnellula subtilissima TaxID=602034 RepID=A0A8H8RL73_9HELO|nr:hypothetical protein LSUB1_G005851 [Lachnellula subtilissima]
MIQGLSSRARLSVPPPKKDLETHWEAYKLRPDKLGLDSLNDPYHGWVNEHRDDASLESKQRIMGTLTINPNLPEFYAFFQAFPKVEIVTSLLIRRQFYRKIAANSLDYKSLISLNLPSTLRELYIFEDFNKLLHSERSTKRANRSLGRALSKSSRFLENLSAAFLVNAEDFFANLWPTNEQNSNIIPWENLRKLALTSRLLHPEIGRGKINKLLIAAGRAAAFMPKLEVMEIWNGGEEHACLFRYSNDAGKPKITWACNWGSHVQLVNNVVHCWANLPRHRQHPHGNLTTVVNRLRRGRKQVKTYVATVRYLKLRSSVLDLISDYQLFWEEYNHSKG